MTLEFGVLGPLEVRRDGETLDLGAPKQRSVLARLLLARGRVVASDRLVDTVWGDEPPPSALPSLQVYVSNLRRLLRDDDGVSPLGRQAPGYHLRPQAGQVDLEVFLTALVQARSAAAGQDWPAAAAAAERAVGCWRGPVLADVGEAEWWEADARSLTEQWLESRVLRATALLGSGRTAEAVTSAQELSVEAPYRDDVQRVLALALHRAGRTPEALDSLSAHAARLDEELGIEPSGEMRDLQVALLRQDPWTAVWPSDPTATGASPGPAGAAGDPPAPDTSDSGRGTRFVGRGPQLAAAREAVGHARDGQVQWLVLTGPAGIGKTRLAEEAIALAEEAGARVVRARCVEEEGAPAWWPVRQVAAGLGAEADTLLQVARDSEADTARFAVYERVADLLRSAAEERLLVVLVDDLQWADETSLRALSYVASTMREGRVLLVATVRATEGAPVARRTVAELVRLEHVRQIAVPPLTESDVSTLAATVAGSPLDEGEARLLAERTGGNALFVTEYARLSPEERQGGDVPLAVRGVLGRRLESLDARVLQVLRAAAVAGDVLDLGLLADVTRLDPDDLVDLLDEAADEHIIAPRRDGAGYAFAHALLREEILAGISPIRRQRLHLRVAEALSERGREAVTQRAQQLLAARPLGEARELVDACRHAALQAEERWSSETAASWWESAAAATDLLDPRDQDPLERDDLITAQVAALARSGRGTLVVQMVDERVTEALREGRPSTVGWLCGALIRAYGTWPWVAFGGESIQLAHRLAGLEEFVATDSGAHARLLAAAAVGLCYERDAALPDDLSTRGIALAEQTGDADVVADALLARVLTYVGVADHAAECDALLDRMLALPREKADVDAVVAHSARTMSSTLRGDLIAAEEHLRLGIAGSDLYRLPVVRVQLRWMEVGVLAWHESPTAALAKHAVAAEAHKRADLYDVGFAAMALMMLRWMEGRLAEAEPPEYELEQTVWIAARAAAVGDRASAEAAVAERLRDVEPLAWAGLGHLVILAHTVADLRLTPYADQLIEILTPRSGALAIVGQGPILGPVDLAIARLHDVLGQHAEATRFANTARELCLRNGSTWWAERCQALAGPVLPD